MTTLTSATLTHTIRIITAAHDAEQTLMIPGAAFVSHGPAAAFSAAIVATRGAVYGGVGGSDAAVWADVAELWKTAHKVAVGCGRDSALDADYVGTGEMNVADANAAGGGGAIDAYVRDTPEARVLTLAVSTVIRAVRREAACKTLASHAETAYIAATCLASALREEGR